MGNENDRLVVGLFVDEEAAHEAGKAIYEWQAWEKEIDLGAMAVLTADDDGDLHADEIGERHTRRGLGIGTAVGAVAGLLSGGIGLIPGMILGGAAGAGLGALNHKSVGMTDEQHDKLVLALRRGRAGLAVMCDDGEVTAVLARLKAEGGSVSHYAVQKRVTEAIAEADAAVAAAGEALDEAGLDVDQEELAEAVKEVALVVDPEYVRQVSTLVAVTGVSAAGAAALHQMGVDRLSQLERLTASPAGRKALARQTGEDPDTILLAAQILDLMRVPGVGYREARLLAAAGIYSVPELGQANPGGLAEDLEKANRKEKLLEEAPSKAAVAGWTARAKLLPVMLYY